MRDSRPPASGVQATLLRSDWFTRSTTRLPAYQVVVIIKSKYMYLLHPPPVTYALPSGVGRGGQRARAGGGR